MSSPHLSEAKSGHERPRSLPVKEWPDADRRAWEEACRPRSRLRPGGVASRLAAVSREDFARRYGAFLGFLQRTDRFEQHASAAAQVTVALAEVEKDLALLMQPRSKFERLVLSTRLAEAGMTLVEEAERFTSNDLARARGVRNGLMIALLALCPIRLKNFAALEIEKTFKNVHGRWWIALPGEITKSGRRDERCVPPWLNRYIEIYLDQSRPVLLGSRPPRTPSGSPQQLGVL